ncbi:integrase family protein [Gemmatirosa kalamazoonensis]|uniref:Integrase family protein n=1 Tax=Gemmatirosa kalamazoonensis TaxID=861299 RepID=W0RDY3_9BACT|nr:integrase arm-type DNA-binding domain-containing protein [Gemmatirosa kalamazoonensis]AHG87549.1 integrase family protein [Gemmatirosa kalamazoonensis]AHG87572.1 integrase family protein [Gemmatirosa kalamazoonensis]AHG87593.1 integrase family protein [Gemmatirosa kalamazoonensis]
MPTLARPLTKRTIDATAPQPSRDVFLWDGGDGAVKGFGLRVRPSGRKTFVFQYDDVGGRTRRLTLGEFGPMTVDQARAAARDAYAAAVAARRDPAVRDPATRAKAAKVEARAERLAPTVRDLATRYLEDRARKGKRARTIAQFTDIVERLIAPKLGARKLQDVTRRDVAQLHHELGDRPYMANRVLTVLHAMFAYAEREELRPAHTNPAAHIERYPERSRARGVPDAQYAAIGTALRRAAADGLRLPPELRAPSQRPAVAKRAAREAAGLKVRPVRPTPWDPRLVALFRFLALSGWRESEARALRWADVDLARGVATLQETKSGKSVRPLGAAAIAVLRGLEADAGSPYVFPGARPVTPARPARPRSRPGTEWAIVRHAAGLGMAKDGALTLHGLRHGFTTVARGLGYGDHVIAVLIGHTVGSTMTSRYGAVPDVLVRKAADDVAREIAALLDADLTPAKVLPITRREA